MTAATHTINHATFPDDRKVITPDQGRSDQGRTGAIMGGMFANNRETSICTDLYRFVPIRRGSREASQQDHAGFAGLARAGVSQVQRVIGARRGNEHQNASSKQQGEPRGNGASSLIAFKTGEGGRKSYGIRRPDHTPHSRFFFTGFRGNDPGDTRQTGSTLN